MREGGREGGRERASHVFIRKRTVVIEISTNFRLWNSGGGGGVRMLQLGRVSLLWGVNFSGGVRTLDDAMHTGFSRST